jgi:CofD-related protein of GAK system
VTLPDNLRLARIRRAPELGPRVLFFSGGTALRPLSRELKQSTHNSVHLITPFDSGGSSAALRVAFGMPSVGDLRNRLMALADETARGNPAIYRLFSHRLAREAALESLRAELDEMVAGTHPLVADIPRPLRQLVRTHLRLFAEHAPGDFDLRGASVGNLMLAGGYEQHERNIDSVLYLFSKLVEVRGMVRPVVSEDLHLCATLDDDSRVVGQHRITGKEAAPLERGIKDLGLVTAREGGEPATCEAPRYVQKQIERADLICFPMGSLFTSVIATLLPAGIGAAIARADCPKVYVPNSGRDPEAHGLSLSGAVGELLRYARRDTGEDTPTRDLLHLVLLDEDDSRYDMELDVEAVEALGIQVVRLPLAHKDGDTRLSPSALVDALLSLS